MISSSRVGIGIVAVLSAGMFSAFAPVATAQGGPGGGFQMPPEMQAKMKAWQKYRDQHKNTSSLTMMLMQVEKLDKEPGFELTRPQAHNLLGIVNAWHSKTTMSEDQAKGVSKQIGSILTDRQIKKMSTYPTGFGGRGGRPGGGGSGGAGGGPGRPGGPGGGRPGGFTFPDPPKTGFNPLNPDSNPMAAMRPAIKRNMAEFVSLLQRQAK